MTMIEYETFLPDAMTERRQLLCDQHILLGLLPFPNAFTERAAKAGARGRQIICAHPTVDRRFRIRGDEFNRAIRDR
jgi:hypothetical protein